MKKFATLYAAVLGSSLFAFVLTLLSLVDVPPYQG